MPRLASPPPRGRWLGGAGGGHARQGREPGADLLEGAEPRRVVLVPGGGQRQVERQGSAGREPPFRPEQRLEAADRQAGGKQQQRGERDLRNHERHAHAAPDAGRRTSAILQGDVHILPGEVPGREQTEHDAGDDRERQREHQHAGFEPHVAQTDERDAVRRELAERRHRPPRDEQPGSSAGEAEHDRLGEHLPGDPGAAGADGAAHRDLPPPVRGLRQQQVGDVHARDQQHERHRGEQQPERGGDRPPEKITERE